MKKGLISIIVALLLVGLVYFMNQSASTPKDIRPEVGFLAPDFTLNNEDGNPVTLSQLKGKPVFLNFWASWCPPCKEEMPLIQEAYEKYGNQVDFYGVNLTFNDSLEEALAFMKSNGYDMPILFDDNPDPNKTIAKLYRANTIPTSVFIDANGVIQAKHIGAMNYDQIESYLGKVINKTEE